MVDVMLIFDEQEDFNNVTLYLQVSTYTLILYTYK